MICSLSWSRIISVSGAILFALTAVSAPPAASSPVIFTESAFCACCADPGAWSLETRKIESATMKELGRLKPDGVADFHATAAWPDDVSGITVPDTLEPKYFVVSIVREQQNWKFFFKTAKGETGALILTLPGTATLFNADNEPRAKPEKQTEVVLYKEVRLEGAVRGTGMFAKGIAPKTRFRLILQGKGNWCLQAEDFYRWNLRIAGPKAGYTIYGFFAKPNA